MFCWSSVLFDLALVALEVGGVALSRFAVGAWCLAMVLVLYLVLLFTGKGNWLSFGGSLVRQDALCAVQYGFCDGSRLPAQSLLGFCP